MRTGVNLHQRAGEPSLLGLERSESRNARRWAGETISPEVPPLENRDGAGILSTPSSSQRPSYAPLPKAYDTHES